MTLRSDHYCDSRRCAQCRELDAYLKTDHVRRAWPALEERSSIPSFMPALEAELRKWGIPHTLISIDFPEARRKRRLRAWRMAEEQTALGPAAGTPPEKATTE